MCLPHTLLFWQTNRSNEMSCTPTASSSGHLCALLAPSSCPCSTPTATPACLWCSCLPESSTVSECLAHCRPLVFVRRDFFNEEPFLRKMLEVHGAAVEMKRRDFLEGHWGPYLQRACRLTVRYRWL